MTAIMTYVGVHILLLVITSHAAVLPSSTTTRGQVFTTVLPKITQTDTTVEHKGQTTMNSIDEIDTTIAENGDDALSLSDTTIKSKEDILEDTTIQNLKNDASDITGGPLNFKMTRTEDKVTITKEPEQLVDLTKKLDIHEVITTTTEQVQTKDNTMATTTEQVQTEDNAMATTTEQVQTEDNTMATTTEKVKTEDNTMATTTEQVQTEDNTMATTTEQVQTEDNTLAITTEQVQTEQNTLAIATKRTTNPNSNTTPIQPRIINNSRMFFGHVSKDEEDNDDQYTRRTTKKSSMINFGGPTNNRENDETREENNDERKSSKVNFGGPTAGEETRIEDLNEVFYPQANDIFDESKNAKKCKKYNLLYSLQDQTCHMPTTTGPCEPQTHWLVAQDDTSIGVCRPRLCTREEYPFLYKGVCSSVHAKCGPGERLYNDRFGEGFCGCEEGFLYHGGDQKCYRENLPGPCGGEKQWVYKQGTWMEGICKRRGCSWGMVMWEDGRCYKVEEGAAFEYCAGMVEGVVKQVEEKKERVLGCYLEFDVRSIAPVFRGRKCRRGRIWNKYRRRCVRTYGWGR